MKKNGFTLIELLITLAIVGIISAVAIPAYSDYVDRSRRSEAVNGLFSTLSAMEKFRLSESSYPLDIDTLDTVTGSHGLQSLGGVWTTAEGNYLVSIDVDPGTGRATGATATAAATGRQASDTDCATLSLSLDAQKTATRSDGSANPGCWQR